MTKTDDVFKSRFSVGPLAIDKTSSSSVYIAKSVIFNSLQYFYVLELSTPKTFLIADL